MKKVLGALGALALLLSASSLLLGQMTGQQSDQSMSSGQSPTMQEQRHLQMLSQQLNLTEDQKAKLGPILHEESQQMRAVRSDTTLSDADRQSKMTQIRETYRPKIQAILTPEQQKKMSDMMMHHEH